MQITLDTFNLRSILRALLIISIWLFLDLTISNSWQSFHQANDEQNAQAENVVNQAMENSEQRKLMTKKGWPQIEMPPINGWIVPARAGTGHIRIQLERICGRSHEWSNRKIKRTQMILPRF